MTTSCCPAWVNLVTKHLPDLAGHVSDTPSPMVYARDIVKAKAPGAKTVFIGPCVAKRSEARRKDVDYVLSFEELGAIFAGRKIDVIACEPWPVERPANPTARNYAKSCGVTEAVLAEATSKIPGLKLETGQRHRPQDLHPAQALCLRQAPRELPRSHGLPRRLPERPLLPRLTRNRVRFLFVAWPVWRRACRDRFSRISP